MGRGFTGLRWPNGLSGSDPAVNSCGMLTNDLGPNALASRNHKASPRVEEGCGNHPEACQVAEIFVCGKQGQVCDAGRCGDPNVVLPDRKPDGS